ncbi:protein phosphatase 1 regulatory subunit 15B-like isoform X1 [Sinocyclocheilus rhinocerous]|uniref:Protein phosphatase 1 regulatory subunit 15B-like n=2 Tax=Sinocyclocheilus rhinocerous TaxID=307959 RepID=A0A673FL62_9TELE|nr:PREDICTED: protein phosphatase 1 regulatory subunit 15B-like isoform X1 [Sinocyclocheilus rhinocerous]
MSTHGHFSQGDTRSRADSTWINVFSVVSRPAWSLLQRYFPARTQTAFEMKSNLDIGNSLTPLNVAYLQCQHENQSGASSRDPGTPSWFTHDSLSELGIQSASQKDFSLQKQASAGYLGTARNLISQVLQNALEKRRAGGERANPESGCDLCPDTLSVRSTNSWWWGGFWDADDRPPNWLLNVAQSRKETDTSWQHCGEHHSIGYCQSRSRAAVAVTTELCVCSDDVRSMHNESAGPLCSKELTHNASLSKPESLPNSYKLPLDVEQQLLVCSGAYNEVAILTPDQDNGYSSLEEEHSNSKLHMKLLSKEQEVSETASPVASEEGSSHTNTTGSEFHSEPVNCEEEIKEREEEDSEKKAETVPAVENVPFLAASQCQNKVIAYIMGSPCNGESESEDDGDWDSNDDDGFDSEGSSHFSDSEDLDGSDDESEEDSDGEEADSETERLWNSLCQNGDPYNPRNFTAPIRTAAKPSPVTTDSSVSESPPAHMSSQLSPPPSSPSLSENESSEDACEMDEEENRRLWNSFSCSADPYSPLNFQAPIQTRKTSKGCRKEKAPGTPRYKREEAEERLDSGFSEISPVPCSSSVTAIQLKKVTFVEEVEEFYASSDEDRHGPWEEIARDRCRFQRRVQEVEETISYCLSPTFRLDIFQRLHSTS